jgi:AcrR family transcriptional regulator
MPRRPTRKEKQAETRDCLLRSAARVFARRGFHAASVDEVAEDAGFSKGAVYSNFEGKEELFLAMLDERFERRLAQIREAIAAADAPEEQARLGGLGFIREFTSDPEWPPLFMEFWAYAQRNPPVKARLVKRIRALRGAFAEIYRQRAEDLGVELPIPADQLAVMTFGLGTGISMERALDPRAVPDDALATALEVFFAGVRTLSEEGAAAPA